MPRLRPSIKDEMLSLAEWSGRSLCKNREPGDWDTVRHNQATVITEAVDRARATCLECPVMMECLLHGVVFEKKDQVWGGMTDEEREEWALREGLAEAPAEVAA